VTGRIVGMGCLVLIVLAILAILAIRSGLSAMTY
jgi:hypothetical protein